MGLSRRQFSREFKLAALQRLGRGDDGGADVPFGRDQPVGILPDGQS